MLMALSLPGLMTSIGVQPPARALAGPYIDALAAGTLPLLLYAAFRRFLQATGRVRPVMVALVLANGVNAAANAVLIHGAGGSRRSAWLVPDGPQPSPGSFWPAGCWRRRGGTM
jgi:MATE family multidrug resistance protein